MAVARWHSELTEPVGRLRVHAKLEHEVQSDEAGVADGSIDDDEPVSEPTCMTVIEGDNQLPAIELLLQTRLAVEGAASVPPLVWAMVALSSNVFAPTFTLSLSSIVIAPNLSWHLAVC